MGYRFSEMNRSLSSASNSNIVSRLASKSITGHEVPIQVQQHYGLELHPILHPNDSKEETCIRRAFKYPNIAQDECFLLEKSALQGLCSCLYIESRLTMLDKVEKCLKDQPFKKGDIDWIWEQMFYQDCMDKQTDVCICSQVEDYYEVID